MRKRLTAVLLTLCMMLTLLPAPAYAAVGDLLGNSPAANQELLDQLGALTGQDSETVLALLEQYGLLDEDGNLSTDQTVELDGVEYTLEGIEALLSDPNTDLGQTGYVDGVPIALGNLATIIAIERELQRIQETYFSGKSFDGEALDNLNSLIDQIQAEGITVQSGEDGQTASAPDTKVSLDVSDFQELEFGLQYGLSGGITSGTTDAYSYTLKVSYDPGLIGDVFDRIVVGPYYNLTTEGVDPNVRVTLTEDHRTDEFTYTYTYDSSDPTAARSNRLRVYVYWKNPEFNPYSHYSFGELAGSLTFSDPTGQMVFQDGSTYSDAHTLLLTTEREAPDLSKTSWTNPENTDHFENRWSDAVDFPILDRSTDEDHKTQVDRINDLITILQGAKTEATGDPITESNAIFYTVKGELYQSNSKGDYMTVVEGNPNSYAELLPEAERRVLDPLVDTGDHNQFKSGDTEPFAFDYTAWSETGEDAVFSTIRVVAPYWHANGGGAYEQIDLSIKNCTVTLLDNGGTDTGAPELISVSAPEGSYCPGQVVPVTLTFDELVKVADDTVITVNNKAYAAEELRMNTAGSRLVLWYRVLPVDGAELNVSFEASDIWNKTVEVNETVGNVQLVTAQRRSAVTDMNVTMADGDDLAKTATVTITLDNAYAQDIQDYISSNGQLPFRAAIYTGGTEVASLPIKQEDDSFATDPYTIPAGTGTANRYHAILQVNEGTAASPAWTELPWWDKSFSSGAIHAVTSVTVHASTDYSGSYIYTIDASDRRTWPTVWATLYTGTGEEPTYTTGTWDCKPVSGDVTATIVADPEHLNDVRYGKIQPDTSSGSGWIRCTFTADNGTADTSDDVTSETYREFYVIEGNAPFLGFASDTVTAQRYAALTLSWGSNLGSFQGGSESYTIKLYQGDFTDENTELDETALVAEYTSQTASIEIPAGVLSEMSATSDVDYTVVVSAPDPRDSSYSTLTDRVGITLESQPVTARLIRPADLYITDDVESVDIGWKLVGLAEGQQATFTVQRVRADDNLETVASFSVQDPGGSYTLYPSAVETAYIRGLKDTYQVTLTVDNGDQAPSTDAFALHVYNSDGLWLVDKAGDRILTGRITLGNTSTVQNYYADSPASEAADTDEILALRQQLGLLEYIGVNYDAYTWNSFRDGIRWATDNGAISINYKQGGLYENIENFSYDTYLPELLMGISTTEGGSATITATHAATGMSASVEVYASTLKDKFYLFQVTPAAVTTLQYTDGAEAQKKVTTNKDGVLALYEPYGIASDVRLSSAVTDADGTTEYLGTIQQEELLSGEGDATKLQLYPLNTVRLREAAKVELTLVEPDGSPLADSPVIVRGGVYKNGRFCPDAGLGESRDSIGGGGADQREHGTKFDTDENGKITIYFDPSEFHYSGETSGSLLPSDQIEYVLEITDIDDDTYYPLFQTVDGTVSPLKEMRAASGVVVLEEVPEGEANKPFIARQTVTYYNAEGQASQTMDVRRSTGFVGPNSTFPTAELNTVVRAWGVPVKDEYTSNRYNLTIVTEDGYEPEEGLSPSTTYYPFASIPVVECDMTLSAATMTDAGWVDSAEDVGLKVRLSEHVGMSETEPGVTGVTTLLQEITLPFRAIDLTHVTPVDKDKNVTGMLFTMTEASALKQATRAFTTDVTGDAVAGKLASGLLNLTGGIDTSVFKMLVTPSDDPTVFNALIWAGYDDLELADADYSEDGVAVSLYSGEFDVGLPSREKVSDMARGSYLPASVSTKRQVALDSTGADLKLQLEGFYEAEIRYNGEEWEVYTKGGGFSAGVGVEFGFDVNAFVGPVPVTGSFRVGGAVQLSFQTALRYDQADEPVNDFLTNLRLSAYVNAFGGFGFDFAIVALKIGLFGELGVDSQNQFLTRAAGNNLQGQQLALQSQVGIKFVAQFLFISYEAVLASVSYQDSWHYNGWEAIEDYWDETGTGLSIQSLQYAAAANGLAVASATATLQSRDYLEQYARIWNEPQARMSLRSLTNTGNAWTDILQANANPASFPEISDDGQLLAYISDCGSPSIYESRAHFSTWNVSGYGSSSAIADPDGFTGEGDSDVDIAGTSDFAAAAWVRLKQRLETKDAGEKVSLEEQNTLMNGAEIVASVYQNGEWTSTRLTNDSAPDLAPAVAANDSRAIVFWRSAVSNIESTDSQEDLLDFDARDCIMYSVYDNGSGWSEPRMLYNGSNGSVKALQAAMLPDGTAIAVYTLDRIEADAGSYEIAYTIVDSDGELGTTMLATSDTWLDENPQVVTANFGTDDPRFVIGWHSLQDGESNIQMLAVDENGAMSNDFPASLTALVRDGSAAVSSDFRFASMGENDSIDNLTVIWSETVEDGTDADGNLVAAHSELKAAKLLRSDTDSNYRLSAPLEVAVLSDNNLVNHFSAYLDSSGQVKAVIQATKYSNDNTVEILLEDSDGNPILMPDGKTQATITIPSEETMLYTATSQFEEYAVEVDAIGVDYENLALDSLTPIQFQIRNTGLKPVSDLTVKLTEDAETASLTGSLQPGESATLTVMHQVGGEVSNTGYTISGDNGISETGTVYLDYPDVGISQMKVLKEDAGERTIAVTLYNASAATLAGSKGRTVKLAFYTDNLLTEAAPVTPLSTGSDITVDDKTKTITISGEDNLSRIDDGTFTLTLTYDVGEYVKTTLEKQEIPDSGVYLYADAWAEGKVGEQKDPQRLPEYHDADNQAAALLTGAYARTGHQYTSLDVEQRTDSTTGNTTATVTLTNNSLREQTVDRLLAVLVNEQREPLESEIVDTETKLAGETSDTQDVAFSRAGQRVLVYPLVMDDVLYFEGLPITPEDFQTSGGDDINFACTYQLRESDSATNLLISAYSTDSNGVTINGKSLGFGGSESVSLDPLVGQGTDPITVEIQLGESRYTLKLLPRDYGVNYPEDPTIITQPQDAAYLQHGAAEPLTVKAQVSDGGKLSYQWYRNVTRSDSGPYREEIEGATEATYTPPTDTLGTIYYFCQVTNTLPTGETAFENSTSAGVTVTEAVTAEHIITFDAAGGACSVVSAVTAGGKLASLPTPTREGYTFSGWFTASSGGEKVTTDTAFTSNTTLFAQWIQEGGGDNPGGGGGGSSSYRITVESSGSGTVTASRSSASAGSTVTLTVEPEDGYQLDSLTAADRNGKAITLNDKGDGTYTFTMPSSTVTVKAAFAPIDPEPLPFVDVPDDAYYRDAVSWAVANGVTNGTSGTTFSPYNPCTRAQMVTFLWRSVGSPAPSGEGNPFVDVSEGAYYYDAVLWAVEQGITNGTSGTTFSPNATVTRGQTVTFLWRHAGSPDVSGSSFTDVAADAYYSTAVAWAAREGITSGTTATTFSPYDPCTRAQIVTFLYRAR